MVREFKSSHTSHIFDVKFDVARIVRCVLGLRFVFSSMIDVLGPCNSTSHDQKIVVLDFSHGLDASLFV